MIKSKRQEKIIFRPPKKLRTPHFSLFHFISFRIIIGLFLITITSFITYSPTQASSSSQSAEPIPETRDFSMFTPSLLPTDAPLPTPVLPFEAIQKFETTQIATESPELFPTITPTPEQQEDYCIKIPVILYHHIQPIELASKLGHAPLTVDSTIFENQIKYLKENGYIAQSAEDLILALQNRLPLPEKSILITIDDGYDDNYTYAFLTAKKYQFVMNFMIPTSLIGKPGYMNWDHLREMRTNEFAKIYNHTATHAPFGLLTQDQISQELATSSADFARELGLETNVFTYPYGSYSPLAIEELKKFGYIAGFTTEPGQEECLSNLMLLKRVRVANAPMSSYGF